MKVTGVLLLLGFGGCLAEVVQDFRSCPKFFASPNRKWSPPTTFNGNQFKVICQTRSGVVEYASHYDTANKIPVYSAYVFKGLKHCKRNDSWFIEPQLDKSGLDKSMRSESAVPQNLRGKFQALNKDYPGSTKKYDKGHLAPVYHSSSQACADATFTLTNAAPQNPNFNRVKWRKAEAAMGKMLSINCIGKGLSAYVVTGVVPGQKKMSNKVRVPSHFWSAFCCLDNNKVPKLYGGAWGKNENNSTVKRATVKQLDGLLTKAYNRGPFQVFARRCPKY